MEHPCNQVLGNMTPTCADPILVINGRHLPGSQNVSALVGTDLSLYSREYEQSDYVIIYNVFVLISAHAALSANVGLFRKKKVHKRTRRDRNVGISYQYYN